MRSSNLALVATTLVLLAASPSLAIDPGDLVITEVMANPSAVSDATGEWVEIYNATDLPIDLVGLELLDDDFDSHTIGASVIVPPHGYALLARSAMPLGDGDPDPVDYVYAGFALGNSGDEVVIADGGTEISRMSFTSGVSGQSRALRCVLDDPTDPDNWVNNSAGALYNPSDRATPRSRNDVVADTDGDGVGDTCDICPADATDSCRPLQPGDLIINELLPNPDFVSDSNGEWFELFNATPFELNLLGLTITDTGADRFVVDSQVLVPPYGHALFAANGNAGQNGGLPPVDFDWPGGAFFLGNNGDEIHVEGAGHLLAAMEYEGTEVDPGVALHRVCPTDASFVQQLAILFNASDTGTPAAINGNDADNDLIADACDGISFSPTTTQFLPGTGNVFHEYAYSIAPQSATIALLAAFLPFGTGLDALDLDDGHVLFSVDRNTVVPNGGGTMTLEEQAVYRFDGANILPELDPVDLGVALTGLNAIDRLDDGSYVFSVSRSRRVSHAGGSAYLRPWQVWRLIPIANPGATLELVKDFGPMRFTDIDAVDLLFDGRLAISNATNAFVALPGLRRVWAQDAYIYDPASGQIALSFDGDPMRGIEGMTLIEDERPAPAAACD